MFGILIAFKKLSFNKGILGSPWCGLDNFKFLFRSGTAFTIIKNTILYNLVFLVLGNLLSIAVAIIVNEITSKKAVKVYQSMMLIPYLMSWVVVNYLTYVILAPESGVLNHFITASGGEAVNWYSEPKYWPFILVFVSLWKGTGYSMIVYLSSIVGISKDYYEAAMLDGATKWQQIKQITLPLLKPTVITLLILSMGRILGSDFGLFYQIPRNSGALYDVTQTIDVYVYNALMKNSDYGMSSAASVFQSVVGFALVMLSNAFTRKFSNENALF